MSNSPKTTGLQSPVGSMFSTDQQQEGRSVRSWDERRVSEWLYAVGFAQYEPLFREHDFNGDNLIECDQQILREIGIKKVGDRIRMVEAIKALREMALSEERDEAASRRTSLASDPQSASLSKYSPAATELSRRHRQNSTTWSRQFDLSSIKPPSIPSSPLLDGDKNRSGRHPGLSPIEAARQEQKSSYFMPHGATRRRTSPMSEPPSAGKGGATLHSRHNGSIDGLSMGQLPSDSPYIRVIYTGGQTKVLNIKNCKSAEAICRAVLRKLLISEKEAKNYCFWLLNGLNANPGNCKRLSDSELLAICMDTGRAERGRLILRRITAGEPDSEERGRAAQFAASENQANHLNAISGSNVRNQIKLQKLTGESWHHIRQPLSPIGRDTSQAAARGASDQHGKFLGFFGARPPSEMIIHELTSYFPSHQKEDIEKTVRLSVRRSKRLSRAASRLSVMSNNSVASTMKDVPPIPTIAESLVQDDESSTITPSLPRPLSVSRFSTSLSPLPSVAYRDSRELLPPEDDAEPEKKFSFDDEANESQITFKLTPDQPDDQSRPSSSKEKEPESIQESELDEEKRESLNQRLSMVITEDGEEEDDDLKAFLAGNNFSEGNWMKGALIGEGSFGSVFIALHSITGELLAVKQVELPSVAKGTEFDKRKNAMVSALKHEIELLQGLHHENIVQYLGTSADDDYLNIFLEYVPGGSIAVMLKQYNTFQEPLIQTFVRQILAGLSYLHSKNIIHRDIKGANILVDNKGAVKISDFGISKKVNPTSMLEGDHRHQRTSLQGSVFWMAPEVVRQTAHTTKADIWSLGCLVVEMFIGAHPFPDHSQLQAIFAIGSSQARPPAPEGASEAAQEFLNMTFEVDYEKRPSADELRESRFVKGDLAKMKEKEKGNAQQDAAPKSAGGSA